MTPTSRDKDERHNGRYTPSGRPRVGRSNCRSLDDLDPVAVRVAHEAQPRAALAHRVGRLLRLDPLLGEPRERGVEVVGGDRDVAVAGADLVRLGAADVVRQLQPRRVAVAGMFMKTLIASSRIGMRATS